MVTTLILSMRLRIAVAAIWRFFTRISQGVKPSRHSPPPPKGCKFFWKVLSFYTRYTLSVPPYQRLSTGSGLILRAGASRASPEIRYLTRSYSRGSHALYLELRQCPALPVKLRTRELNLRHASSLLVTTPRRWSFPFGPTLLGGFRTTRSLKNTQKKSIGVGRDPNPGRLISSLTLYPLFHRAPSRFLLILSCIASSEDLQQVFVVGNFFFSRFLLWELALWKLGQLAPVSLFTCKRLTVAMFEIFMLLTSPRIR